MMPTNLKIEKIQHRGTDRIAVRIPFDSDYIFKIKQINGYRWSQTKKCWHIPYDTQSFQKLKELFGDVIISNPNNKSTNNYSTENDSSNKVITIEKISQYSLKVEIPGFKTEWIRLIKQIPGMTWNPSLKHWKLPYNKTTVSLLKTKFKNQIKFNFNIEKNIPEHFSITPNHQNKPEQYQKEKLKKGLNPEQIEALQSLEEQLMYERRSPATIKSYISHTTKLFLHYPNTIPEKITDNQIKDYIIGILKKRKFSVSSQNQFINAIKVYYKRVLHQERELLEIRRPKKPNQLPHILSQNEVVRILNTVENIKHKCILMLVYSAGLRVSEVVNLKIKDIDSTRMQIFIQGGKGKKDRYTILSKKTLLILRQYFKQYHPYEWLIEGIHGGQYSVRSVQNIFQTATQKAKISKRPTLHTLRHSFATHLLEKGINLRYIQSLLGHESSTTTEIYTHVTKQSIDKIESPLDGLDI